MSLPAPWQVFMGQPHGTSSPTCAAARSEVKGLLPHASCTCQATFPRHAGKQKGRCLLATTLGRIHRGQAGWTLASSERILEEETASPGSVMASESTAYCAQGFASQERFRITNLLLSVRLACRRLSSRHVKNVPMARHQHSVLKRMTRLVPSCDKACGRSLSGCMCDASSLESNQEER